MIHHKKEKNKRTPEKRAQETYGTDEVKRYLGSLSEDFQGRVEAIGEQYHDIKETMEEIKSDVVDIQSEIVEIQNVQRSHTEMIGTLLEDTEEMKGEIVEIKSDIVEIQGVQRSHTEMFGVLGNDVEIIKQNVEFLKEGFKRKVDYDEFMAHEHRLSALEAKIQ